MAQPNFPLMIQNLNALNMTTRNVSLELSRLPNILTINVVIQVKQIQTDHRRLGRIQRAIQALDVRSFCRTELPNK
ncbi:hypothetical protein GLOIN_2v100085 [Rhizophagus clarus]|uniref:Uncharacterized protein n=1 Tax=Rhizophagus clarus TaxID=94130 RepID=A0A8H3LF62_9GLOM|nr:hypothetical protein GLOIN_2v100085 [Rhizophagus clarus]